MPRRRARRDDDDALGPTRCDDCGGVLSGAGAERDIVGVCSCPGKRGVKARAAHVGYRAAVRAPFGDFEIEDLALS